MLFTKLFHLRPHTHTHTVWKCDQNQKLWLIRYLTYIYIILWSFLWCSSELEILPERPSGWDIESRASGRILLSCGCEWVIRHEDHRTKKGHLHYTNVLCWAMHSQHAEDLSGQAHCGLNYVPNLYLENCRNAGGMKNQRKRVFSSWDKSCSRN